MRIIGYCTRCHRIKSVRVQRPSLRGVPQGVCADCEREG